MNPTPSLERRDRIVTDVLASLRLEGIKLTDEERELVDLYRNGSIVSSELKTKLSELSRDH